MENGKRPGAPKARIPYRAKPCPVCLFSPKEPDPPQGRARIIGKCPRCHRPIYYVEQEPERVARLEPPPWVGRTLGEYLRTLREHAGFDSTRQAAVATWPPLSHAWIWKVEKGTAPPGTVLPRTIDILMRTYKWGNTWIALEKADWVGQRTTIKRLRTVTRAVLRGDTPTLAPEWAGFLRLVARGGRFDDERTLTRGLGQYADFRGLSKRDAVALRRLPTAVRRDLAILGLDPTQGVVEPSPDFGLHGFAATTREALRARGEWKPEVLIRMAEKAGQG